MGAHSGFPVEDCSEPSCDGSRCASGRCGYVGRRRRGGRRAKLAAGWFAVVAVLAGCGSHPFGTGGVPAKNTAPPPVVRVVQVGAARLSVVSTFSTDKERQAGLQNRQLPPAAAAVFTWDGATTQTDFWMIHTPESLDLLWVLAGRVVGRAVMPTCSLSCPTYHAPGVYDTAVEARAGAFAGVRKGEAVTFL